jgi:hypothetical protein
VEYQYHPLPFTATTEKQESYCAWDLPKRPAPVAPPVPLTRPFEGAMPGPVHWSCLAGGNLHLLQVFAGRLNLNSTRSS